MASPSPPSEKDDFSWGTKERSTPKKYVKKIGGSLFSSFGVFNRSLWGLSFQDNRLIVNNYTYNGSVKGEKYGMFLLDKSSCPKTGVLVIQQGDLRQKRKLFELMGN